LCPEEIGRSADFFPRPDALRCNSISSGLNAGVKRSHREQKAMGRPYYILLADNHAGFRREVRKILEEIPGVKVTGEAGNCRELLELVRQSPPELVILDISLPDLRAMEGTQFIKMHYPETQVLIMVMDQEHEYLTYGLAAGAAGVLPKQYVAGQMARAITAVRQGNIYLPPQIQGKNSPRVAAPAAAGPGGTGSDN
jgi:DNA-binding NarL/FixJ family response regulator